MRKLLLVFFFAYSFNFFGQDLTSLIPENTATHTAVQNGPWFDAATWSTGTIPNDGAIVVIPSGFTVNYEGQSNAHIFVIRVDGSFICTQKTANTTTTLTFDTFVATHGSHVKFLANDVTDGSIDVDITPFDIEAYKSGSPIWNNNALAHFSDKVTSYKVTKSVGPDNRFNSYQEALAGNTTVTETSRSSFDDGVGVIGRHQWDPDQVSIGIVTMGQLEIIGKEKTSMIKLSADALKNQTSLQLEETPTNWGIGDQLLVTRDGNINTSSRGEDEVTIQSITNTTVNLTTSLKFNHIGRPSDNLHAYVGNLTRNISFSSGSLTNVHHRAHMMAMHNDANVQVKNAVFKDMGRTDKSVLLDDFIWDKWLEPKVFNSKISALGQEVAQLIKNPIDEVTNPRGRYSIHLHKTGAHYGANMTQVTGNVIWGNPGWGITHHDSHATVSDNVVYDVVGAGIVSETGSETGFWDRNLVVKIAKGHSFDMYDASLFHDDYLFSGQGLGMKGRSIICRDNVIVNANQGVGVVNFNASVSNLDRVDALALANRPGYEVDNFPLSVNGYSKEGDGVMPLEAALIMENTTVIWAYQGLRSIERDMGVNHESRSVFDGYIVWGANQGISLPYQADYSFKDVFVSGKNSSSIGIDLWKHSHNQTFDQIKLVDLGHGIAASKLVESGTNQKTRNNGFTPWIFVDLITENVDQLYRIEKENTTTSTVYTDHGDNTIHLSSSDITSRPTTFTVLDNSTLEVDYATNDFRFEVDGIITDNFGSYEMGIKQAEAQGTLRIDYPKRIYEFASQSKFEEYLSANGVYKDVNDNNQPYFILYESLPDRQTFTYKKFPVRVKIKNAPSGGVFANLQIESDTDLAPQYQIISRLATVSQSSTDASLKYQEEAIDASATKAIDGNNNGRINVQFYQRGLVPLGSFSSTNSENEAWLDMDLGEHKLIDFIDIWNTVELNGSNLETVSTHFKDFYVLISDQPFTGKSLQEARTAAKFEHLMGATPTRKLSINDINTIGRYIRIQSIGVNKIKLAEIEIIGKKLDNDPLSITKEELKIRTWPNPTKQQINIDLGQLYTNVEIEVVNLLGQTIYRKKHSSLKRTSINLYGASGVYLLKISGANTLRETKKIILE